MKTRTQKICEDRAKGMTLQQIGDKFELTREAIRRILEIGKKNCSKKMKAKIVSMQKHQYHPPHYTMSSKKWLLIKKWIYQYAKNGTSIKEIAKIFYTIPAKKIKEIIQEMEKYPVAQMVGELYDKGYKVRSIRKRLKLSKQEFDESLAYYQKSIKPFDK